MYCQRIQSNLGCKIVSSLDGAQNTKEMKAQCLDSIANTEEGITMASGMRSIELGYPEHIKRRSLRVGEYQGAIPMASGIPSRKSGDLVDILTASLREEEYRRAIVKLSRCGIRVSGWINSTR